MLVDGVDGSYIVGGASRSFINGLQHSYKTLVSLSFISLYMILYDYIIYIINIYII